MGCSPPARPRARRRRCSGGADGGGDDEGDDGGTTGSDGLDGDAFPSEATIHGWIAEVVDQGIRRPGYAADEWAEQWVADRFRDIGLEDVALEPVDVLRWEPAEWTLEVTAADGTTERWTASRCRTRPRRRGRARRRARRVRPRGPGGRGGQGVALRRDAAAPPGQLHGHRGSIPAGATAASRSVDPKGTLAGDRRSSPSASSSRRCSNRRSRPARRRSSACSRDYPGDSYQYYVPYDADERPLPGVWVRGSDGARLRDLLAAGPVRVRLAVATDVRTVESDNVVGELPGADDEVVMIASHHDGPWASAVEDGSGIALVLAQATYWAAQPGRGAAPPAAVPAAGRPHVRGRRSAAVHRATTATSWRRWCSRCTSSTRRSSSAAPDGDPSADAGAHRAGHAPLVVHQPQPRPRGGGARRPHRRAARPVDAGGARRLRRPSRPPTARSTTPRACRSSTSWPRRSTCSTPWTRSTRSTATPGAAHPGDDPHRRVDRPASRRPRCGPAS